MIVVAQPRGFRSSACLTLTELPRIEHNMFEWSALESVYEHKTGPGLEEMSAQHTIGKCFRSDFSQKWTIFLFINNCTTAICIKHNSLVCHLASLLLFQFGVGRSAYGCQLV